jgi:hypothetical protein
MQIKKGRCLIPASHFFEFTGTKRRNRSGDSPRLARIGSALQGCGAHQPLAAVETVERQASHMRSVALTPGDLNPHEAK